MSGEGKGMRKKKVKERNQNSLERGSLCAWNGIAVKITTRKNNGGCVGMCV